MRSAEEWAERWDDKAKDILRSADDFEDLVRAIQADAAEAQREAIALALSEDAGYEMEYGIVTQIRAVPLVSPPSEAGGHGLSALWP